MNLRKCFLTLMMALVLAGPVILGHGCKKSDDDVSVSKTDSLAICLKCGQIKGTDLCCKPDQLKCSKCNLAKGSPGCCNIPKP